MHHELRKEAYEFPDLIKDEIKDYLDDKVASPTTNILDCLLNIGSIGVGLRFSSLSKSKMTILNNTINALTTDLPPDKKILTTGLAQSKTTNETTYSLPAWNKSKHL
ncbi:unnamed protein product [Gordionus sp. m RMFG-2023]